MEMNVRGLRLILAKTKKPPCENLTQENIEKVRDGLAKEKTISQISRETGITVYYVNKIKKGEKIPMTEDN